MDLEMISFGILKPSTNDTLHNIIRHSSKKGLAVFKKSRLMADSAGSTLYQQLVLLIFCIAWLSECSRQIPYQFALHVVLNMMPTLLHFRHNTAKSAR